MSNKSGINETGSILDRIIQDLRPVLERRKRDEPEAALRDRFDEYDPQWHLGSAILKPRGGAGAGSAVEMVAEIKRASPSRGLLAEDLQPVEVASTYTLGGATGISIVTEPNHFLGDIGWLSQVRHRLSNDFPGARPSLLRKDFIFDPYDLVLSRAYGADSVLLIAAVLEDSLLHDLLVQAEELGLSALVEVHTEQEAGRAVAAGATLFGINNRDLRSFDVDLATSERIRPLLPEDAVVVGESGVHTRADVQRLHEAGVNAVLVGEALMTANDPAAKMSELRL